jgi:hypothetical protein
MVHTLKELQYLLLDHLDCFQYEIVFMNIQANKPFAIIATTSRFIKLCNNFIVGTKP